MPRLVNRFNRLMPCPNDIVISVDNSFIGPMVQIYESTKKLARSNIAANSEPEKPLSELNDRLGEIVDITGNTELAEIKGRLLTYGEFFRGVAAESEVALAALENPIDNAVTKMGEIACSRCSGIVVDRRTGIAYCGREVPEEVIEANEHIDQQV